MVVFISLFFLTANQEGLQTARGRKGDILRILRGASEVLVESSNCLREVGKGGQLVANECQVYPRHCTSLQYTISLCKYILLLSPFGVKTRPRNLDFMDQ